MLNRDSTKQVAALTVPSGSIAMCCHLASHIKYINQSTADMSQYILPQKQPFPTKVWALECMTTQVHIAKWHLDLLSFFVGSPMFSTHTQTDRPCYICKNRPHLVMQMSMHPQFLIITLCLKKNKTPNSCP